MDASFSTDKTTLDRRIENVYKLITDLNTGFNSDISKIIEDINKEFDIDLQVLSGEDEARLTFLAVRRWFGWSSGRLLVVDIGGGSLEIASGGDEAPDAATSLPLGAARLTKDFLQGDPFTTKSILKLREHIESQLESVLQAKVLHESTDRAIGRPRDLA